MAATPFKAMSFKKNDTITRDSMDQLQNNMQWVYDNTPRGQFIDGDGEAVKKLTTVVAGRVRIRIGKKEETGSARVRFGEAFSSRCHPHVTTAIVSDRQRRIWCVVNGPQGINLPNSTGFEVKATVDIPEPKKGSDKKKKKKKAVKEFWVHWHAFGYREDDMNEF